jgi:hypothetical protein
MNFNQNNQASHAIEQNAYPFISKVVKAIKTIDVLSFSSMFQTPMQ